MVPKRLCRHSHSRYTRAFDSAVGRLGVLFADRGTLNKKCAAGGHRQGSLVTWRQEHVALDADGIYQGVLLVRLGCEYRFF